MSESGRRGWCAAAFAFATVVVLILASIPMVRLHHAWGDEIHWTSTCLSILHHQPPVPSVLADFPETHSPLPFYGSSLFWAGVVALKLFGVSAWSWRSYAFTGNVLFLLAIAAFFRHSRKSWCVAAMAAFAFSLSISNTFWLSLPGRTDMWTLALIVLALVFAALPDSSVTQASEQVSLWWLACGLCFGVAATTTPRCFPLLLSLILTLPLLAGSRWLRALLLVAAGGLVSSALLLLPLHTTPWGHVLFVRRASTNDTINMSPLMGGTWGFGHANTQIAFYGALLVMLGLLYMPRWREQERIARWLLVAGLLNLLLMTLLVAGALSTPVYWGFPLEIAALLGLTRPGRPAGMRIARALGIVLLAFLALLRVARELPAYAHWTERDPAVVQRAIASTIPSGSVVYGPISDYFYAVERAGSDYLYLNEFSTTGLTSVPGEEYAPSNMAHACRGSAFLVWPAGNPGAPVPQIAHGSLTRLLDHSLPAEHAGTIERLVERVPGGRSETDYEGFAIYRLRMDPAYCAALAAAKSMPAAFAR